MLEPNTKATGSKESGKARDKSAQKTIQNTMDTSETTKDTDKENTEIVMASRTRGITSEARDMAKVSLTSAMETSSKVSLKTIS